MGGTCVNRGCVPSKALLAASGRVREMQDTQHLDGFGIEVLSLSLSLSLSFSLSLSLSSFSLPPSIHGSHHVCPASIDSPPGSVPFCPLTPRTTQVGEVKYDREKVAAHAAQLVSNVAKNLGNSLTGLGVDQIHAEGAYAGPNKVIRLI